MFFVPRERFEELPEGLRGESSLHLPATKNLPKGRFNYCAAGEIRTLNP